MILSIGQKIALETFRVLNQIILMKYNFCIKYEHNTYVESGIGLYLKKGFFLKNIQIPKHQTQIVFGNKCFEKSLLNNPQQN